MGVGEIPFAESDFFSMLRWPGYKYPPNPYRQNVQQLKKEHRRSEALINKAQESLWLPKPSVWWSHREEKEVEEGGVPLQTKKMG